VAVKKFCRGTTAYVKGGYHAVVTNDQGVFLLTNVDRNATLVISSVGYEIGQIKVHGRLYIAVTMRINAKQLDEASVVSTGYQKIPKERATGSFAQVDNELLNRRVSTNVLDRLEGVTSGYSSKKT